MSAASLLSSLKALFRKDRVEGDLPEELQFHLQREIEKNIATGMSPKEARYAALRSFGGIDEVKERCRALRQWNALEALWRDLKHALRGLKKSPSFTAVALVSLAVGIAANTTAYSLFKAILVSRPSATHPEQLMNVMVSRDYGMSYLNYRDLEAMRLFAGLAAYVNPGDFGVRLRLGSDTRTLFHQAVSVNYFDVLGVRAGLGRLFTSAEAQPETDPTVIVLSHGFWQRLGSDPGFVGKALSINGTHYTVLGVLPKGFRSFLPHGLAPEVYIPLSKTIFPWLHDRSATRLEVVARVSAGMNRQQVRATLMAGAERLEQLYPKANRDLRRVQRVYALSGLDWMRQDDDASPVLLFFGLLLFLVALVLLVACANVASLLLARATTRRREIAVRLALGASRGRLIQQLLIESLALSLIAGGCGLVLHVYLTGLISHIPIPLYEPREIDFAPDSELMLYAFLLTMATTMLCGLVPALQATRFSLSPALKQQESHLVNRRFTLRNGLVVGQVAVSLLLLVTAALFLRNLLQIRSTPTGFNTDKTLTAQIQLANGRYNDQQAVSFLRQALARLEGVPGVASVGYINFLPLSFTSADTAARIEGNSELFHMGWQSVGPQYFSTLQIPRLRGREFEPTDDRSARSVAIVNETLAHRLFPGLDPVGRRLLLGEGPRHGAVEIVGVVRDSKYFTLGEAPRSVLYRPFLQIEDVRGEASFVLRAMGRPESVLSSIKQSLNELDSTAGIDAKTMRDHLVLTYFPSRISLWLLGSLASVGLLMAAVGLYGVMTYLASRRISEIGIRMALGATRSDVLRMVIREGLVLVGIGVGFGLVLALPATRPLALFLAAGLSPSDPASFASVIVFLGMVGLAASIVPAYRAARIDPVVALRHE
jgi:predicted permease